MPDTDNITRLFSTPVFQSPELYKFNKSELEFIDKQRENAIINQSGNLFSKNNYVLESPELKNLKEFCNNNLFIFFYDRFKVKKDIEIYITQSWINFNQKNTSHHRHKHINSIISSVIFIKGETCPITFYNSERNLFGNLLSFEDFTVPNENNTSQVYFNNKNGRLFLFPSTLMHSVARNKSDVERISLSFNTFIKGQLGGGQNSLQTLNIK
tara:strand:- start:345 stop:980 length:636 start_codon:yes stop_codon:yes gene_type:complete